MMPPLKIRRITAAWLKTGIAMQLRAYPFGSIIFSASNGKLISTELFECSPAGGKVSPNAVFKSMLAKNIKN